MLERVSGSAETTSCLLNRASLHARRLLSVCNELDIDGNTLRLNASYDSRDCDSYAMAVGQGVVEPGSSGGMVVDRVARSLVAVAGGLEVGDQGDVRGFPAGTRFAIAGSLAEVRRGLP